MGVPETPGFDVCPAVEAREEPLKVVALGPQEGRGGVPRLPNYNLYVRMNTSKKNRKNVLNAPRESRLAHLSLTQGISLRFPRGPRAR